MSTAARHEEPTDDQWHEAKRAKAALKRVRASEQRAKERLYAAVRVLYRRASRPQIADRLDIPEDTVKWIVEDKAAARRRRTERRPPDAADDQ